MEGCATALSACPSLNRPPLPCLHLPLGVGRHGLPIGLQLIGRFMDDERVLQAGAWLHSRLHD